MSNRHFENDNHTKLYKQYRLTTPKNLVEHVVKYLMEKYTGELSLAVDVGCGSGQSTLILGDYFKSVIGTDISPNQLQNAKESNDRENVSFELSPAETLPMADGSVQLVTAMAAVHWFDLPNFFEEGRRILCPGGVMALYGYGGSLYEWERDPKKSEVLAQTYGEVTIKGELAEYWSPRILEHVLSGYRTITIPYDDFVRDNDNFFNERRVSLADILGETQTWSGFERYNEAHGPEAAAALIEKIKNRILDVVREDLTPEELADPSKIYFQEKTPLFVLLARKL